MMNPVERYHSFQRVLHWLIAGLILFMLGLGAYMVELPKQSELPEGQESVRAFYFLLHKSMGLTIGLLILLRIYWRLTHPAPRLPSHLPSWQIKASRWSHFALYFLMVAVPLSGYLQSMYSSFDTYFWGITLPRLAEGDADKREIFTQAHQILVYALVVVMGIHIAAAVRHWRAKDGISRRISLLK